MNWQKNLKERNTIQWSDRLKQFDPLQTHPSLLIEAPCDLGIMRNGGKRGAKHAPPAIRSPLSKMIPSSEMSPIGLYSTPTHHSLEIESFQEIQCRERETITGILSDHFKKVAHIGGGHDHIYPLLAAYLQKFSQKKILILNIDAHLDTRVDEEISSGTPFRQLFKEFPERIHLIQIGIHSFANHPQNYQKMGQMEVLPWGTNYQEALTQVFLQHKDKSLCLSLDCDGLDASFMSAVSAPNHRGLSQKEFWSIFKSCQSFWDESAHPALYGIYEFNPLFDDLTTKAARFLASTLYDFYE